MPRYRRVVTLLTEGQAFTGHRFRVIKSPQCRSCRLRRICIDKLREEVSYKVVKVRKKTHTCPLLNIQMKVVEVEEQPFSIALRERKAVEGAIIAYEKITCSWKNCKYRVLCNHPGISRGDKIQIIKTEKTRLTCPLGFRLRKVSVILK